jgi:guanylate kinase
MGETGSGKSTIERELSASGLMRKIVSHTNRYKREEETDGVDYHFVSDEEFERMVNNNEFIEHTTYNTKETFGKNFRYGISKEEIEYLKLVPMVSVVTPSGYKILKETLGDNILPVYIKTDVEKRKEMALKRHGDNVEKYREEIERRFEGDKETFKSIYDIENLYILENDYTQNGFIKILKSLINEVYFLGNRKEIVTQEQ